MVKIGSLFHPVTFERRTEELDSFGQVLDTWSQIGEPVQASVRTLTGRELLAAREVRAETTVRVMIRAGEVAFDAGDRILFNGRTLEILAAFDPTERGREIWIDCAERPGSADG